MFEALTTIADIKKWSGAGAKLESKVGGQYAM